MATGDMVDPQAEIFEPETLALPGPPVRSRPITSVRKSGGYNTARAITYTHSPPSNSGYVIERRTRPTADGYDLRVLPSHAVYMVVTGVEAAWLPHLVHEYATPDGDHVQILNFSGHTPAADDAQARELAEAGFAECMQSVGGVATGNLARWQAANVQAQRDPTLQERPLVFEGPPTWDAARRAKLRQLWEEVYARVPQPFGPTGPSLEEFWSRLEPLLPPVEAVGPGRLIHFDGKPDNVAVAEDLETVIDWDMAAVSFAAREHAAVIDLVRYLHLDGRNPLTTAPELWLPTAKMWAQAVPDARQPVDQATKFYGPVGREALYDLATSAACDFLRNGDGTVPAEYAVNAAAALLPLLGFTRVPVDDLRTQYTALHGRAPGATLINTEPTHGPPRQTEALRPMDVFVAHTEREILSMRAIADAMDDIRRFQERTGQTPTQVPRQLVRTMLTRPAVFTGGIAEAHNDQTSRIYLGQRTATALRDGLAAGLADLHDPSQWVDLPRMPEQARVTIAYSFPKAPPATTTPAPRPAAAHGPAPAVATGLSPLRALAHHQREHQANGCAWIPESTPLHTTLRTGRSRAKALDLKL